MSRRRAGPGAMRRVARDENLPPAVLDMEAGDESEADGAQEDSGADGVMDLLLTRIGSELFAIPVIGVEEIIEVGELRELNPEHELLLGLAPMRDRMLPVYRTDSILAAVPKLPPELVLVLHCGGKRLGIAVDDVEEVIGVEPAVIRRTTARGVDERLVRGVVLHEERLLTMLNTEALVARLTAVSGPEIA